MPQGQSFLAELDSGGSSGASFSQPTVCIMFLTCFHCVYGRFDEFDANRILQSLPEDLVAVLSEVRLLLCSALTNGGFPRDALTHAPQASAAAEAWSPPAGPLAGAGVPEDDLGEEFWCAADYCGCGPLRLKPARNI